MINIEIKHYIHRRRGCQGLRFYLNPNTGKTIVQDQNPLGL
jgi:hypothetical protein